jgi:hypothetical protein
MWLSILCCCCCCKSLVDGDPGLVGCSGHVVMLILNQHCAHVVVNPMLLLLLLLLLQVAC